MKVSAYDQGKQPGFTLVELLIVIVVIAILAAISIVAYNGIQNRARASAASSGLAQAKKKLELYKIEDGSGSYPTTGNLASAGVVSGGVDYQYTSDGTSFCITGTAGDVSYKASNTTNPTQGGCNGHGQGGVGAITNLAVNPSFKLDTTGWTGMSATLARVTSPWSVDGNGALRVTATGQDSFAQLTLLVQPGITYTILGTIHLEAAQTGSFQGSAQQRNILPAFHDGSGAYISGGGGTSSVPANTPGTYTLRTVAVAPAGAAQLRLRLYNGASSGNVVYWDQVMVVTGDFAGAYADGDSSNWIWSGTANSSTSTGPPL